MSKNLDYNSIIPLYAQVVERIRLDMASGCFNHDRRLPSEVELAEQYQVSRITIRRAIDELVREELVEKKQGKGTFICGPKLSRNLGTGPVSFSELCLANGLTPKAEVLDAGIATPERAWEQEKLGIATGQSAVRIRRLRYAGDRPLVLEDNYFPIEYSYLLSMDLENDSIYRFLREQQGVELKPTSMRLRIVRADHKIAKLLNLSRNTPLLEMRGCVLRVDGQVVHTSYQIGYGEDFEFIVR